MDAAGVPELPRGGGAGKLIVEEAVAILRNHVSQGPERRYTGNAETFLSIL